MSNFKAKFIAVITIWIIAFLGASITGTETKFFTTLTTIILAIASLGSLYIAFFMED